MDETKRAWDDVSHGFEKLGEMISERYKRTTSDAGAKDAIRRAVDELDRAFTSLGDSLRDDEVREHLRATGKKLGDALKTTFSDVSERVRRTVDKS
jgi:hypothetical protein